MLSVLLVTLLCLSQTIGCDSKGNSEPDIAGNWTGSVWLPNSPFDVSVHYKLNITNNSVEGSGTYDLAESAIFRTTEIEITGTFSFPVVTLEFRDDGDRVDVFAGIMQESGDEILGTITFPRMPLSELSANPDIPFSAIGGDGDIMFERVKE
ncbi:MAG: hypothetical protein IH951_06220 [Bacteroidetes bacterium]|nr:hypothetical protein [Bacteroidota bacterium]